MFTDDQKAELNKPLSKSNVKERKQAGRALSYIEGWHAIAEANRIFGFDGWDRTTVEIRCVSEHQRKIGNQGREGWGVSYIARVRVSVSGVCREGVGAGHGIDVDLGLAHESAIKEAETDAMKRCLMTFGNPFGLALYDKEQANVCDDHAQETHRETKDDRRAETVSSYIEIFKSALANASTREEVVPLWREGEYAREKLNIKAGSQIYNELHALWVARGKEVSPASNIEGKAA
jgi:DNA repair and recombination protein RAD52